MKKKLLLLVSLLILIFSMGTISYAAQEDGADESAVNGRTYYYDQFNNEAFNRVYDSFNDAALKFHNSTANGEFKSTSENEGYYVAFTLTITKKDWEVIGSEGLDKIVTSLRCDHPEYFWMSADYDFESRTVGEVVSYYVSIRCYDIYATGSSRQVAKNNLNITIENYANNINTDYPDYIKAYLLHNAIIEDSYVNTTVTELNKDNAWAYCADGIFNSKYKSGTEYAYAKAYKAVMDYLNIPCIYVEGEIEVVTTESVKNEIQRHCWNQVYLNGEWYIVNLALDDPETATGKDVLRYDYFNITSSSQKMSGYYTPEGWPIEIPEAKGTEYSISKVQSDLENSGVWQKDNYSFIDMLFDKYGISIVLISFGIILLLLVALIKRILKRHKEKRKNKVKKKTKVSIVDHSELDNELKRPPLS